MKGLIKDLLSSKKFVVMLAGILAVIAHRVGLRIGLNVNEDAIQDIVLIIVSFIVGQGIADFGKEAEKTKARLLLKKQGE